MVALKTSLALLAAALAVRSAVAQCEFEWTAENGETCQDLATAFGITLAQFIVWNPQVGANCDIGVVNGDQYCVAQASTVTTTTSTTTSGGGSTSTTTTSTTGSIHSTTSSSSTTTSSTTTLKTTTKATTTTKTTTTGGPQPEQTGIISTCNKWYYVQSGDTCSAISSKYSVSITEFYAWNPAVGSSCATLFPSYYVCVGVPGAVSVPFPTQPGIISSCDEYYMAVKGDNCNGIASKYGITLSEFYSWNPAVGTSCGSLFANYYYCVCVS